ncbi:Hypothetical protein NGK_0329 [Neisseria gonorrhoeae NCCP11945]|uniref:Uncharacterized protein n=1 Tax=Neisseria gonorrhoeae (strain NCCP11945) TaxID=521006 RepID=B4RJL9_NEIG2|nr:Hypothetical protein NGK_0329 [Neisseria gonorrhoeae NCCP11945]
MLGEGGIVGSRRVGVKYYRGRGIDRKCRLNGAAWKKYPRAFQAWGYGN